MAKLVCNFISYALKRTVDITVVLPSVTIPEAMQLPMPGKENPVPPTHEVKEKYPVLYLLHGMGNNHAQWTGYTNVEMFAEERNMAVVMISGENKFYHDSLDGEPFFDFVAKEVPEFVTNYFPISAEPEHSYIAGLSMGGYGALLHGLSNPERFAAIGSFSGAVMPVGDPEKVEGLIDGPLDVKENGVDVTWVSVPGYTHEWRFWNLAVEKFLKWIPRTDGYVSAGARQI